MNFAEFGKFVTSHSIETLDDTFTWGEDNASKKKMRGRFDGMQFERIPCYRSYEINAYSERSFFGELVNILHLYSILRLFAEANEDAPVVWQYGPLVQAGWATDREFVPHFAVNAGTCEIAIVLNSNLGHWTIFQEDVMTRP